MSSDDQSISGNPAPRSPRRTGRTLPALAVLAAVAIAGIVVARTIDALGPGRPPSVIFVLVDTLRADYLGSYGFAGEVSPNLDALAADSVLFERAFAQAPWTKPSVASLFTSLAPETHRVLSHQGKYGGDEHAHSTEALPVEAETLAEGFQQAGYATAAFVANPWMLREHGFAQGFDVFHQRPWPMPPSAEQLLEPARQWLEARKPDQPFFLYLHFMDVHGPYDAPDADYDAVKQSPGLGPSRKLTAEEASRLRPYLLRARWTKDPDVVDVRTWRGRYAAGVHALDRQLGPFLAGLERAGVLDDAIVVITSDHGEELADNGGWDHGHRLYDHQIHVPLLVRMPGAAGGGRRVGDVVSLIDLMPTLLAQGGVAAPSSVQGTDLSPLLAGERGEGDGASYASGVKWQPALRSLRAPDWKLIQDGASGAAQLFDLTRDPHEQSDVAATRPGERARLEAQLGAHETALAELPSLAPERAPVSGAMKDRLEALGYAE